MFTEKVVRHPGVNLSAMVMQNQRSAGTGGPNEEPGADARNRQEIVKPEGQPYPRNTLCKLPHFPHFLRGMRMLSVG